MRCSAIQVTDEELELFDSNPNEYAIAEDDAKVADSSVRYSGNA